MQANRYLIAVLDMVHGGISDLAKRNTIVRHPPIDLCRKCSVQHSCNKMDGYRCVSAVGIQNMQSLLSKPLISIEMVRFNSNVNRFIDKNENAEKKNEKSSPFGANNVYL